MAVTAFWSPMHGVGTTAVALSVATCLAESHDARTLVTQTNFAMNDLERPLIGVHDVDSVFLHSGKGLDKLLASIRLMPLNEQAVINASFDVPESDGRLFLLSGTQTENRELFFADDELTALKAVLSSLRGIFEEVIVDTNAGYTDKATLETLYAADNVVICLRQNYTMIGQLLNSKLYKELAGKKDKNIIFCLANYDEASSLSLRNITKSFREISRDQIGCVPHVTGVMDAISNCSAFRYFVNEIEMFKSEKDSESWWGDIEDLTEKIM